MPKLVSTLKFAAVVKVSVAVKILPGSSFACSLSQTQVIELLMVTGYQLVFSKLRVRAVVPEFLT
jgi:hypothetical protein